jgi:hypothetical protein
MIGWILRQVRPKIPPNRWRPGPVENPASGEPDVVATRPLALGRRLVHIDNVADALAIAEAEDSAINWLNPINPDS